MRIFNQVSASAFNSNILQFKPRDPNKPLNYKMQVNNKKDTAEIQMYDMIGMWGISADQFGRDLKALGDVKHINLHISSDGGDVFEGRAIFSLLVQHPARVVSHIDGLAASIATLIALAGNEVRMADGSFFMIHNAWGVGIGDSRDLRKLADLLESVNGSLLDTYQAKTKLERDKLIQMMDDETWMTANEAKDYGFADVVSEPLKVAASIQDPSPFKRPPAALLPNTVAAVEAIQRARAVMGRGLGQGA